MKARALIVLLTLESVLHACSHAFVLRKRSTWDQNNLSEALQLVERERQRLGESEEGPDESWEVPSPREREKEAFISNLLRNEGEESFPDEFSSPGRYISPQTYDEPENREVITRKRKKSSSSVGPEELQSILGPYPSEQYSSDIKRPAESDEGAYDTDYKKRLYDPSEDVVMDYDKKDLPTEVDTSPRDLSSAEVSNLLDEVENVEKNVISQEATSVAGSDEDEAEDNRQAEVSKDELADVLKDDEEEEENHSTDEAKAKISKPTTVITTKPNGVTITKTQEKEWPSAKAVSVTEESVMFEPPKSGTVKRSKHKRSGNRPIKKQTTSRENAAEIARKYLKVFLQLEDDENSNLANALNIATLSQIKRTDKFIPEEIRYLRKAILDEEMIQKLDDLSKKDLVEPSSSESEEESPSNERSFSEEGEEAEDEEVPLIRKRQDPGVMPLPRIPANMNKEQLKSLFRKFLVDAGKAPQESAESWYDGPVDEKFEGNSDEKSEENMINPFLRELMRAYEEETGEKLTNKRADDASLEKDTGLVPAEDPRFGESAEDSDEEITNALAAYVEQLTPGERRELSAAVEDKLASETCPAVRKMSDNCAVVDQFKLTVDDEARNLCNRHQMCYTCGAANGRSRADCDAGYLEEAKALCEGEQSPEKCKDEAAGMFLLLSKMHPYVPFSKNDESCAAPCVMRYVIGPNAK